MSAPRVFGDFEPYVSPASGRWIEGRRARREDFARTNTRPYEDGETQDAIKRAAEARKAQDAFVDEAVERTAAEMGVTH